MTTFFDEHGHLPQLMDPLKTVFTKPEESNFDFTPQEVIELKVNLRHFIIKTILEDKTIFTCNNIFTEPTYVQIRYRIS